MNNCNSPSATVGSPNSFLSELSGVIGNQAKLQKNREGFSSSEREEQKEPDRCSSAPHKISLQGCLKPSKLDMFMSPEKRPPGSFEESQSCQDLMAIVQGNNTEKRSVRKGGEMKEMKSRVKKVLVLHVCATLKPYLCVCAFKFLLFS